MLKADVFYAAILGYSALLWSCADSNCITQKYYIDIDKDGFGSNASVLESCTLPNGYVKDDTDCDDLNGKVNPSAIEICDLIDNDCNGSIDDEVIDASTWFLDGDSDGYGGQISTTACSQPNGHTATNTDCDDVQPTQYPGAEELCDGLDNDCDGLIDEDIPGEIPRWYFDGDGDGYGNALEFLNSCVQPDEFVGNDQDCNDESSTINPGVDEICNDKQDNNCNNNSDHCIWSPTGTVISSFAFRLNGTNAASWTGYNLADIGDIDGDGDDELLIGAPRWHNNNTSGNFGSLYIIDTDTDTDADVDSVGILISDAIISRGQIRSIISGAGDITRDNYLDIIFVSENTLTSNVNIVCLGCPDATPFNERPRLTIRPFDHYLLGKNIAGRGDIDGSGVPDVLVSSRHSSLFGNIVYIFKGPITEDLTTEQSIKIFAENSEDRLGWSMSIKGDLSGDMIDDVVIGADRHSGAGQFAGAVYVITAPFDDDIELASHPTARFLGVEPGDHAGWSVAHDGDVNGDGFNDLLVGAPLASRERGEVYLIHGPITEGTRSLASADSIFSGFPRGAQAGSSVALIDLNDDGFEDVIIGAPLDGTQGTEAGAIYIFWGPTLPHTLAGEADLVLTGETAGDRFGRVVASIGDVNGDGLADLGIGAHLFDGLTTQTGAVYILHGLGL